MARLTEPRTPRRAMAINTEDLPMCRRDRDFTNLLDLKYEHHTTFLKRLKHHAEFLHSWKELRGSAAARSLCIDQFLDMYGAEYWGGQDRAKYIMSDSVARGDDVRYPEDSAGIKKALVLLIKKKADGILKDNTLGEPASSQTVAALQLARTAAPEITAATLDSRITPPDQHEEEAGEEEGDAEEGPPRPPRPIKRRLTSEVGNRITPPDDTSSLTSLPSMSTATPINTIPATSNMSTLSLVDESLAKVLHSKYRRDTFFLVATDLNARPNAAPAWAKFQNFKSASSFLLDMSRECGLEKVWWTPNAQMEVEGGSGTNQADYVSAAQGVISMASVRFEWSDDEVLVRWGNDSDWGIVMQMIQKAWVAKEFGHKHVDLFKIRVVLQLEN